jgi:hypothetical protein
VRDLVAAWGCLGQDLCADWQGRISWLPRSRRRSPDQGPRNLQQQWTPHVITRFCVSGYFLLGFRRSGNFQHRIPSSCKFGQPNSAEGRSRLNSRLLNATSAGLRLDSHLP